MQGCNLMSVASHCLSILTFMCIAGVLWPHKHECVHKLSIQWIDGTRDVILEIMFVAV